MAKNTQGKTGFGKKLIIISILAAILGLSCIFTTQIDKLLGIGYKGTNKAEAEVVYASDLVVNYLDVGQGDSTYIEFPNGETMLIDASESKYGDTIVNYLRSRQGLEEDVEPFIDYLILTHSDSDHAGGMEYVLNNCKVKNIYRPFQLAMKKNIDPETQKELEPVECYKFEELVDYKNLDNISKITTETYATFIELAYIEKYDDKNYATVTVSYDDLIIGGEDAGFVFEFFMPRVISDIPFSPSILTKGYPVESFGDNNNNNSPVMLLEYKEFSFVFTGDAEKEVEEEFLNTLTSEEKARFVDVSVFQAGHHGSSTSNTAAFMELINPTYTVVSCGSNNKYKHPNEKFLNTINSLKHTVDDYLIRTDLNGNIVFGASEGVLVYVAGVDVAVGKVVHWYHIAIVLFVGLSIVIISIKFKSDGGVTKTSVRKGTRNAKKVIKRYFD